LLEETHCIAFGPGGLLQVPDRVRYAAQNLFCFPTREEIPEINNKGAPLSAVCDVMKLGCVPSLSALLLAAGYYISEESVAMIWVRADKAQEKNFGGSCSIPIQTGETGSSQGLRHHLSAKVRSRMVMLCNEVCPRDEAGIMLVDRSQGAERRPSWCIAKIMHELDREFDVSELRGVKEKVITYISRTAVLFKRLQNMTEEEWLSMSQDSRERKREMLKELKVAAESWKNSPYGYLWIKEGMRRQPTANEINLCEKQTMEAVSAPVPPAR
jgi:hypothetical protein